MEEVIRINDNIRSILMKHTRKTTPAESLNEILKNDLTRRMKKYKIMLKHFEQKYNLDFDAFETSHKNTDMKAEIEKDYFDWDMAVTAIEDLEDELRSLES
jgi:hypothetical protein